MPPENFIAEDSFPLYVVNGLEWMKGIGPSRQSVQFISYECGESNMQYYRRHKVEVNMMKLQEIFQ